METEKKISELRIPLPTASDGHVPQQRSFRWCKALHEALQPLRQFKLQDGGAALAVAVASGPARVAFLEEPFGQDRDINNYDSNISEFLCRIVLLKSKCTYVDTIWLTLADFLGNAAGAKKKFARVIRHLDEHAVPQIAPEWIKKALGALRQP